MQIKKGQRRLVFLFPSLRIVIKFPLIYFKGIIEILKNSFKKRSRLREYWSYPVGMAGLKGFLFGGVIDNWEEYKFYRENKHIFLQPTYFSLFGLLNIQRAGEPCEIEEVDLWCQLYQLTSGDIFDDAHHFDNPENFCFRDGRLRMLDYGSERTHNVINRHGAKIVENFDPAYSREEEKEKEKEKGEGK